MNPELKERLDALVATGAQRRDDDPVGCVHRYSDAGDREIVGLVASSLAFGNVVAIRASVARALGQLGASPAATVRRESREQLAERLEGFVHRVYRGRDVAAMLANAGALLRDHGTLGAAFAAELARTDDFREALASFADHLRGRSTSRGLTHLVPDPRVGSACKRLLLYLRWMVRREDGIDLGLWPISPAVLLIPVDTHVLRIGRNLGLTRRKTADWKTAVEITAALREMDPSDPTKYDFAICHFGVSKQCPSRRDREVCERCVMQDVCRHWRRASREPRVGFRAD